MISAALGQVNLDWDAYWTRFKEAHGGDPVPYQGKLLFQDGWTYSAKDKEGPEWPPPDDDGQLMTLQRAYWGIRLRIVEDERVQLKAHVKHLQAIQDLRSVPLQHRPGWGKDSEGKAFQLPAQDLDLSPLEDRLRWLKEDAERCIEMIGTTEAAHA